MKTTLTSLTDQLENAVLTGDGNQSIEQLEYDSRLVRKNALFFAIHGYQVDGYDYVSQAKANGAVAVLGERTADKDIGPHVQVPNARKAMSDVAAKFYGYPGRHLRVCGVTGTNGKTTTCFLIKNILEAYTHKTGLVTSQVYDTGGELFDAERTTPESLDMQRLLYLMKGNDCTHAVLEVSSHALVLHRVDNIDFHVAVYTNITRDHLDFHESAEAYLEAKKELARRLTGEMPFAVLNLDVKEFRSLFGELTCRKLSYALSDPAADIRCGSFDLRPERTIFDLVTPHGTHTVSLALPGRFNLQNALAAAAGGLACGVDLDHVVHGLESARPVPGRLSTIDAGQPFAMYIDYAHTPDALKHLCKTVRELIGGRLGLLFGCGGDRDRGKRAMMGEIATTNADYVVVTSDNPRSEDAQAIIDEIKPGLRGNAYTIVADRKEAIATILKQASPGDAVLLAGKGAEPYQEINGVRHPFSDEVIARSVVNELYSATANTDEEN